MPAAPRVSVIVPVYNAAPHLPGCVAHLVRQTLADIEILLVDDGSSDDSRAVAASLAAADARVSTLHQDHVGPGAARNRGLDAARAPYVTFVDADDELTPDGCEAMLGAALASGADIVVARTHDRRGPAVPRAAGPGPVPAIRALYTGRLGMSAYAKLYRRAFLDAGGVRFPPAAYIEDRHFLVQGLVAGARLAPLEQVVYRRQRRADSTMHRVGPKHVTDATLAFELDAAVLERAGLLADCGAEAALATLRVDLFLARAPGPDGAALRPLLAREVARQAALFARLPGSAVRRALTARAARRFARDLERGAGVWRARGWLALLRGLAR